MEVKLPSKGRFVVAVSGGVDSVVLLHLLVQAARKHSHLRLIVAHFDHGIRADSTADRDFVKYLTEQYGLPFVSAAGKLGPEASEALARTARYRFLRHVKQEHGAQAIVTAHHRDDVLETAILNLLRGTGRKGLTSLSEQPGLLRPLLTVTKQEITLYADEHFLSWHEDSTNSDQRYRRNYVRQSILAEMDPLLKQRLFQIIDRLGQLNGELDRLLSGHLQDQAVTGTIGREWFVQLPHSVALEVMASYLRAHGIADFDSKTLERLVVAAKVAKPGKQLDVRQGKYLRVSQDNLALKGEER